VWESPCSPLPIGYCLKAPEEQKHTLLAPGFYLGLTMLPFVFPFPNF
jgi:hypothetical protein